MTYIKILNDPDDPEGNKTRKGNLKNPSFLNNNKIDFVLKWHKHSKNLVVQVLGLGNRSQILTN